MGVRGTGDRDRGGGGWVGRGLPELAALVALEGSTLDGLLVIASIDIDVAQVYQGRRYDLTNAQTREFPRVAYGPAGPQN